MKVIGIPNFSSNGYEEDDDDGCMKDCEQLQNIKTTIEAWIDSGTDDGGEGGGGGGGVGGGGGFGWFGVIMHRRGAIIHC